MSDKLFKRVLPQISWVHARRLRDGNWYAYTRITSMGAIVKLQGLTRAMAFRALQRYLEVVHGIPWPDRWVGEHDPDKYWCRYLGGDMWTCGHVDNDRIGNGG